MIFPSGLKRICDISFYMTFASIVGRWAGADNMVLTLPIFVFVAFLSAFLAPRGRIRYISVLPLFLVFVITPLTVANAVVLVPAILFMIVTLPKPDEQITQFNYDSVFYVFILIFGIIALTTTLFSDWVDATGLLNETWLFATSFLFNSVMFMRMIRHDVAVLKQNRFKIINAITLIGVIGAITGAVLLGTDIFLSFVWGVIRFIWSYLIAPVINFTIWIFVAVLRLLGFNPDWDEVEMAQMLPVTPPEMDGFGESGAEEGNLFAIIIATVVIGIVVIAVVVLLIYLFKLLTNKGESISVRDDGVEEERFSLDSDEKKRRRFGGRSDNQIREVYRRFLTYVKKKGISAPLHSTSYDVEGLVATQFESEKSSELRDEYIRVRYRESEYTKDDVKRVKGLYKEIKQEIEKV